MISDIRRNSHPVLEAQRVLSLRPWWRFRLKNYEKAHQRYVDGYVSELLRCMTQENRYPERCELSISESSAVAMNYDSGVNQAIIDICTKIGARE